MNTKLQGGFIVKDVSAFRRRHDVINVQPISTNSDGSIWVTATILETSNFSGDENILHAEPSKPIGRQQKRNVANCY
jgi:hypothetical protein